MINFSIMKTLQQRQLNSAPAKRNVINITKFVFVKLICGMASASWQCIWMPGQNRPWAVGCLKVIGFCRSYTVIVSQQISQCTFCFVIYNIRQHTVTQFLFNLLISPGTCSVSSYDQKQCFFNLRLILSPFSTLKFHYKECKLSFPRRVLC